MDSPRGHLSQREKEMIMSVYRNIEEDFPELGITGTVQKTAKYTGCSISIVNRARKEKTDTGTLSAPKKPRRENLFTLDEHQKYLIRKTVHQFFFENQPPTLDAVHACIKKNDEIPAMSRSKLYNVLKELNFRYGKRCRKSLLVDRSDIIDWRRRYLRKIKQLRMQGRPIFYLGETWINAGHTHSKVWMDNSIQSHRQAFNQGLSVGLRNPSGKGKRLIILHIGNENGFVDNGLLLFEGVKDGDYHNEMNAQHFEEWFDKILKMLPPGAVIVLDNAPYHSRREEKCPTTAWKKVLIQQWLDTKQIVYDKSFLKFELLNLVKQHKYKFLKYVVDEMAAKQNKLVLRLPPYHCELNPIELIWAQIKKEVAANNTTFKLSDVKQLFNKACSNVTAGNWHKKCVQHVITEEAKMWKLDNLMETAVESLIINLNESDESDWSSESDKENVP